MKLKDLVGKMAIRTEKVCELIPLDMERVFRRSIMTIRVPIVDDREKYMDKPVRIMAVEGSQVVIEEDGERKLLERKYIDDCWTDYERLLHPEEEEKEKTEKLMKEFEEASEPIKHFLAEHYDQMCTAVISMDNIQIFRGELGKPAQNICCWCGAELEKEMRGEKQESNGRAKEKLHE